MLGGKYFCGCHHSCLVSVFNNGIYQACRNCGFAGAYITLYKPVARIFAFHILQTFGDCPFLCIG